jgi:hypothetical protein
MGEVAANNAVFICTGIPVKCDSQWNDWYPVCNPLPTQFCFEDDAECLLFVECFCCNLQCALLEHKTISFYFQ